MPASGVFRNVKRGRPDQARQDRIQKCGLGGSKILAFSPSKWCILMHSRARFRPTRPITAIMMFMTSAEIIFFTFKGGQVQGPPPKYAPDARFKICKDAFSTISCLYGLNFHIPLFRFVLSSASLSPLLSSLLSSVFIASGVAGADS